MPYIGKPQSADPITVNSSNITDGTIVNADLSSSLTASISGAFTETSSSLALRLTDATGSINNISGSNSTRTTTLEAASSSLASDVVTLKGGGTLQSVATNASPTFVGATITGTLTAQEVHTEFESASILFSSGSTQFGNSSDDVHDFKGNTISGSATSTASFGSVFVGGAGVNSFTSKVGIGTDNPTDELEVHGATAAIKIRSTGTDAGNNPSINFQSTEATGLAARAEISADDDGASTKGALIFKTRISDSVTEAMRIDSSGFVGIGTNNPTVQLEVYGSADQQIRIDSTGNRAQLQFDGKKTSDAEFAEINFANDGDSAAAIHAMRDGANDAARLAFFTQPTGGSVTERMSIDSSGLVGIGTASPAAHLEVVGGTDYSQIQLTDTDTDNTVQRTGILSQHYDSDEQAIRMIGMYSSDTTSNVQIGGGSGDHNSATLLQFFTSANTTTTAGTLRMIVSSSGYVGIGTDNPGNPLHLYSDTYPQLSIDGTDNSGNIGFVLSGSGGRGGMRWNGSNNDVELLREGGGVALSLKDGAGVLISADVSGDYGCFINNSNATGWGLRIAGGADSGDYIIRGQNEGGTDKFVVKSNGSATINQGADDGEILTFKSSDVAHGVTARTETDTYGFIKKGRTDEGGVFLGGYTELDIGITLDATSTSDITDKNTGANGNILVRARKKDGTGDGQIGSNANLMVIENYDVTRFIFDAEGDFHADNTVNATAFDTYNDAQLVRAFDLSHGKGVIQSKFDEFVNYQHETLAELGLVGREDDGTPNHFINITGMQRLHNGAIWQQYTEMEKIKELMYDTIVQLLGKETADKKLEQHDIKLLDDSVDGTDNIWSRLKNKTKSLFKIIK